MTNGSAAIALPFVIRHSSFVIFGSTLKLRDPIIFFKLSVWILAKIKARAD
jgi:hypothetical protein